MEMLYSTMIMGGFTVGCIISAHTVNHKRNAALASLYSLTKNQYVSTKLRLLRQSVRIRKDK